MIVSCAEMRRLEEVAFANGSTPENLMEQAGWQITQAVAQFFPVPGNALIYFGKGHNGGDALVAARHLAAQGWSVTSSGAFPENEWSILTVQNYRALSQVSRVARARSSTTIILDGLLGIGASGPLREPIHGAAREINRLRREQNAYVFALDLPSGLDGDTGIASEDAVVADFTLTIGRCKKGLVADSATPFVGRLAVLPLPELTPGAGDSVSTPDALAGLKPRRKFDTHKTNYGRVTIVAGSMGLTGAAILAAEGALRGGAGLVRLFVTPDIHAIVAGAVSPEIMVRPFSSFEEVLESNSDVLAIGPGLGQQHRDRVLHLIKNAPQPMIVDADALTILASEIEALEHCVGPRLLTPHPGEMARLSRLDGLTRAEIARQFTDRWPVTLLLKGARTIVAQRGLPLSYNSTGNPGMSTGGMGDVLTGVAAALLGQKLGLFDTARLAAWVCGRAAEMAVFSKTRSEESLAATDVVAHLGPAFDDLRAGAL